MSKWRWRYFKLSAQQNKLFDNELSLSYDKNIILSQEIFIRFIDIIENNARIRSTAFQIAFEKTKLPILVYNHHIIFGDISNKTHYLIAVENDEIRSN